MRKQFIAMLGVAMLALAFGATPVVASNGGGTNNHSLDCNDEGYRSGVKLYRDNSQGGGGPIMCGIDVGSGWAGRDGNLGTQAGDTEYEGIWNFNNEANSAKFYASGDDFASPYTDLTIKVCAWSGSQGAGSVVGSKSITVENDTDYWVSFNLSDNDDAQSVAWDFYAGSFGPTCAQVKTGHGW